MMKMSPHYIIFSVITLLGYACIGLAFHLDDPSRIALTIAAAFIIQLSSSLRGLSWGK